MTHEDQRQTERVRLLSKHDLAGFLASGMDRRVMTV